MNSVIGSALNGLIASSSKLQESASRIVRAGAKSSEFLLPEVSESMTAAKAYNSSSNGLKGGSSLVSLSPDQLGADSESFSLAEEFVQMKVATQTYKANATVIRTAFEMEDELIKTVGRRSKST